MPETFDQDEGIGRYALLCSTIKRRTTTNLKTENNQNCEKIELYGSPTTKELKKKYSSRLVMVGKQVANVERTNGKAAAGGLLGPAFACG